MVAFNKNGLLIEFRCERDSNSPAVSIINVKASNTSPSQMSEFLFQAAVPKVWYLADLQKATGCNLLSVRFDCQKAR